jgi:hypothetical protein
VNPKKKLKTFNVTYRPDADNRYNTKTVTYKADSIKEAEALFHAEHPEYKTNKQHYLEIHSPLSNYAIDDENEKIAETQTDNNNTTITSTTTTTTTTTMKKFNILNAFKTVNEYVHSITMLIVGLIPLLLLGVVLFGDNFFLGNIVVFNIQSILDSMGGFVGIITLILIVTVFHKFYKNN